MDLVRPLVLILLSLSMVMTSYSTNVYADDMQIPAWIKSNAKWWSEGQISDSDFVQGIQYLIKQEIIKIPKSSSDSSSTAQQIPAWIKNNAGWWANGKISDNDFVAGIQYLIKVNIIKVSVGSFVKLSSDAFENNAMIPQAYTCDGEDISPPLKITGVPDKAKSLALIMDDPDAPMGTFTHWIIWNIPPTKSQFTKGENLEFPQGTTDFGSVGYGGPCPPSGTHRYFFKLYALDSSLDLKAGATRKDLETAMTNHIIEQATLVGKYSRG